MMCRFCNIETKEIGRALTVLSHTVVVLSNPRLREGHLLVIPKRHVLNLHELSSEERAELFDTAILYQKKLMACFASGCDLKQHNRPFVTENDLKVDHVHIHLLPREFEDELYLKSQQHERAIFKPLSDTEVARVMSLLS